MIVKLLTEHHCEFLSLNGGYRGSSKSTHVKMPRHAIMCLREIHYVMRYDVVKSDVIISHRA